MLYWCGLTDRHEPNSCGLQLMLNGELIEGSIDRILRLMLRTKLALCLILTKVPRLSEHSCFNSILSHNVSVLLPCAFCSIPNLHPPTVHIFTFFWSLTIICFLVVFSSYRRVSLFPLMCELLFIVVCPIKIYLTKKAILCINWRIFEFCFAYVTQI